MQRVPAAMLLVVLVLLAGCGGGPATGSPTGGSPTTPGGDTPTATPTSTPPPTPALAAVSFPAGASADGFDDAATLVDRQRAFLRQTPLRLTFEVSSGDSEDRRLTVISTGNRSLTRLRTPDSDTDVWTTPAGVALQTATEQGIRYQYLERNSSRIGTLYRHFGLRLAPQVLSRYLYGFEWTATGATRADGHTYVTYRTTGVNESYSAGNASYVGGNLTLRLRADGLVTRVTGTTTVSTPDATRERTVRYRVTDVGTATVDRPGWVNASIPRFETRLLDGGRVLAITLVGGPAVETGQLLVRTTAGSGRARFDGLSVGETVYITATRDGETLSLTVHRERPTVDGSNADLAAAGRPIVTIRKRGASVTLLVERNTTAVPAR